MHGIWLCSFCHQFIHLIPKILFLPVLLFKLPACVDRNGLLCTWSWTSKLPPCSMSGRRRMWRSWRHCSSSWVTSVTDRPPSWRAGRTSCRQHRASTAPRKRFNTYAFSSTPRYTVYNELGPTVFDQRHTFMCSCFAKIKTVLPPSSCPSSWTVYWACSVLTWLRLTEQRSSKTLNCWRRSCRVSVCVLLLFVFAVNIDFL